MTKTNSMVGKGRAPRKAVDVTRRSTRRPVRRHPGRPSKLTPKLVQEVADLIRGTGAYLETAAAYAGVARQTLFRWLKRGRLEREAWELAWADYDEAVEAGGRPDSPEEPSLFVAFCDAVEKAQAASDLRDLAVISAAAQAGQWQAAAWRLERKHPDLFGRRRLEVTGANGGPVNVQRIEMVVVENRGLTKEEFQAGVRDLAPGAPGGEK